MYLIAEYIPEYARIEAANREYRGSIPRDADVCLKTMGEYSSPSPLPDFVAEALIPRAAQDTNEYVDCVVAASKFIRDWDKGEILDLVEALGVNGKTNS